MNVQCTQGTSDTAVIKVILGSFGAFQFSVQCTQGTSDTEVIKVILGSFRAFQFLTSLYLENGWS